MEWSSRNSEIPHMQIGIVVLIILVRQDKRLDWSAIQD